MFKNFMQNNAKRRLFNATKTIIPKSKSAYLQNLRFEGQILANKTPEPNSPATFTFPPKTFELVLRGKSLFKAATVYEKSTDYKEEVLEGRRCISYIDNNYIKNVGNVFKQNTRYTVTVECKVIPVREGTLKTSNIFSFYYTDGTRTDLNQENNSNWVTLSFTSRADKTVEFIGTTSHNYANRAYINIDSFMVEEGAVSTGYEPYFFSSQVFELEEFLNADEHWSFFEENKIISEYDTAELNGDEDWQLIESHFDTLTFCVAQPGKAFSKIYCNYFTQKLEQNHEEGVFSGELQLHFTILKSRLSTADLIGFKEWVGSKSQQSLPVTIIYKKKQPKIIEVPQIQSEKLSKLQQFHTNACFAEVSSDSVIANFNAVSYAN